MRAFKHIATCVLVGLPAVQVPASRADAQEVVARTDESIEPIPEFQDHINRALEAMTKNDRAQKYENAARGMKELFLLRDLASGNDVELVRQLAYAASKWPVGEETIVILVFFSILEIDNDAVVAGLAPYLDADGVLGELSRLCFRRIGGGRWPPRLPLEPVNYSAYKEYVERQLAQGEPLPEPFVELMYERAPNYAMLAFLYAHEGGRPQQREVLWAEHVVSDAIWRKENGFNAEFQNVRPDAISALGRLAINKAWWVRLYVAEIVDKYPDLRSDSLVERLSKDENQLVRKTITREGEQRK